LLVDYYRAIWPLIRLVDPETAHRLTVRALKAGLVPAPPRIDDARLRMTVWGRTAANPIGLAAGFDKNAEAIKGIFALGFGLVEVGTVTPRPQPGNPRPRVFRLPEDGALINRLGFNNDGLDAVVRHLSRRPRGTEGRLLGANVGPNRDAADASADCARAVGALAPLADYLVINVSSPNTPGLRALQERTRLRALLNAAKAARAAAGAATPLLVKIAPDLTSDERHAIVDVTLEVGIDGLIATNTTVSRPPGLRGWQRGETGGLSGRPLMAPSTAVLAAIHRQTGGSLPLIGVGGVSSADDAYAKICAGASFVQLYTALVYRGPHLIADILRGLLEHLDRDGFTTIAEAVGTGADAV
jgi:dihydroorotate dehydrogenase